MTRYEYKSVLLSISRNAGVWTRGVNGDSAKSIEKIMNKLGQEGWELVGVFPVTDGGSPAQISKAIHHFKRTIQ